MDKSTPQNVTDHIANMKITNGTSAPPKSRSEMTEEEKQALKERKKAEKLAIKQAKKAKKAQAAATAAKAASEIEASKSLDYTKDEFDENFGEFVVIRSQGKSKRGFVGDLKELEGMVKEGEGSKVWVRVRIGVMTLTARVIFLVLRKDMETVQAIVEDKTMMKWMKRVVNVESIVDVLGEIKVPVGGKVEKCTVGKVELVIKKVFVVSKAAKDLPFTLDDAKRVQEGEEEGEGEGKKTKEGEEGGEGEEKVGPFVSRETRLDARVIDLRIPPHVAVMRIQSGVCRFFRQFLTDNGFTEIHSPKLIAGASEGGADVFTLDYMGRTACLAQSPQLYKQMAICGDMKRVFEIGPVFRAEKSFTHRHLCEFTGLDLEMEIVEHYDEVLDMIDRLFVAIFNGLNEKYNRELESVRSKWDVPAFVYETDGKKNLRLEYPEGIKMLREAGFEIGDFENMSTPAEKLLGKLVKEKYKTDFFILTKYPSAVRPFYTMVDPKDGNYSNSFDVFMRGEEIISGAQRIHDVELLKTRATAMLGEEGVESIQSYIDAFKYGAPPHGGCGVGLERVVMLFLGVGNIRECSMFPRDPKRLTP